MVVALLGCLRVLTDLLLIIKMSCDCCYGGCIIRVFCGTWCNTLYFVASIIIYMHVCEKYAFYVQRDFSNTDAFYDVRSNLEVISYESSPSSLVF